MGQTRRPLRSGVQFNDTPVRFHFLCGRFHFRKGGFKSLFLTREIWYNRAGRFFCTPSKGRCGSDMRLRALEFFCSSVEISAAFEFLTKERNNKLSRRLNDRIAQLLGFVEDEPMSPQEYEKIQKELEDLERQRRKYRILRKVRCALIHAVLHRLWLNRVQGATRALAKLTFDPMSITMPIPPTSEAANSSLGRGRIINGFTCYNRKAKDSGTGHGGKME